MTNEITKSIIVDVPSTQAYSLWADFTRFPEFMEHVKSVELAGNGMSHWVVAGPLGTNVDWNAEVTRMETDSRIAWNTKDHEGTVTTSGQVTFNPLSTTETEVTVTMKYATPGGKVGEWVAGILAHPEENVKEDLRRFKQFAEAQRITSEY
jgi:uncharacterized membrane protein